GVRRVRRGGDQLAGLVHPGVVVHVAARRVVQVEGQAAGRRVGGMVGVAVLLRRAPRVAQALVVTLPGIDRLAVQLLERIGDAAALPGLAAAELQVAGIAAAGGGGAAADAQVV